MLIDEAGNDSDFSWWLKRDGWTVHEAVCLLFLTDPDTEPDDYEAFGPDDGKPDSPWEVRRMVEIAIRTKVLSFEGTLLRPPEFIKCAKSKKLRLPPYFDPSQSPKNERARKACKRVALDTWEQQPPDGRWSAKEMAERKTIKAAVMLAAGKEYTVAKRQAWCLEAAKDAGIDLPANRPNKLRKAPEET